jgi:hypothetical protein
MDLSKLRRGELIAAAGGIVLLVALFVLDWYAVGVDVSTPFGDISSSGLEFGAWDGQGFTGTIANLVILAAAIAAIGLAVVTATSRTITLPVAASALTAGLGLAAVVMVFLRMVFQPGQNEFIELRFGIWLALISSAVIAYGGWDSMREEGTSFEDARDQLRSRGPAAPAAPAEPGPVAPSEPVAERAPEEEGSKPPPRPAP